MCVRPHESSKAHMDLPKNHKAMQPDRSVAKIKLVAMLFFLMETTVIMIPMLPISTLSINGYINVCPAAHAPHPSY